MQIFKQRALAARQVIRPVEYAVCVVAESQFKLVGRNGFGIKQLNHGRLLGDILVHQVLGSYGVAKRQLR